jgi:predicted enzyme related to lactoylglutathione lyase
MKHNIGRLIWLALLVAVFWSVAAAPPAIKTAPGTFVWHDLVTSNVAASRAFYGELFGWTFEAGQGVDPGYTIIKADGEPIGGIVVPREKTDTSLWLSYVVVADVDRAVETFRQSGGTVFRAPLNARGDLRVAAVADAQGAAIGLASRGRNVDDAAVPAINRWLWMDYVAKDPAAALDFYGRVIGFTHEVSDQRENFTYHLLKSDRPHAGLFGSPWANQNSTWLPYVRVADPAAAAARAVQIGGRLVLAPAPHVRNGSLAIVLDPAGAPLALQKYPFGAEVTP